MIRALDLGIVDESIKLPFLRILKRIFQALRIVGGQPDWTRICHIVRKKGCKHLIANVIVRTDVQQCVGQSICAPQEAIESGGDGGQPCRCVR